MHGAMSFFVFVFIVCQIVAVAITGGGMGRTALTANLLVGEVATAHVTSTANFLNATPAVPAYLLVVGTKREVVEYTGKTVTTFTGMTRAVADPQTGEQYEASAFVIGDRIMTTNIGAIDSFMGFNVAGAQGLTGTVWAVVNSGIAMFRNIPRMLTWDYPWFQGQASFLRYPLFALSAGFVWTIVMAFIQLAQGILRIV